MKVLTPYPQKNMNNSYAPFFTIEFKAWVK